MHTQYSTTNLDLITHNSKGKVGYPWESIGDRYQHIPPITLCIYIYIFYVKLLGCLQFSREEPHATRLWPTEISQVIHGLIDSQAIKLSNSRKEVGKVKDLYPSSHNHCLNEKCVYLQQIDTLSNISHFPLL